MARVTESKLFNQRLEGYKKGALETAKHFEAKGFKLSEEGQQMMREYLQPVKRYSAVREERIIKELIDKRSAAKNYEKKLSFNFNEHGSGPAVMYESDITIKASQNEEKAKIKAIEKILNSSLKEVKAGKRPKERVELFKEGLGTMNYFDDLLTNEKGELITQDNALEAKSLHLNLKSPEMKEELQKFRDPIFFPDTNDTLKNIARSNKISTWKSKTGVSYDRLAQALGVSESDLWETIKSMCFSSDQYEGTLKEVNYMSNLKDRLASSNIDEARKAEIISRFDLVSCTTIEDVEDRIQMGEDLLRAESMEEIEEVLASWL